MPGKEGGEVLVGRDGELGAVGPVVEAVLQVGDLVADEVVAGLERAGNPHLVDVVVVPRPAVRAQTLGNARVDRPRDPGRDVPRLEDLEPPLPCAVPFVAGAFV